MAHTLPRALALLALLLPCAARAAALPIDSLFATLPREALPLLDRTARLDLLDLYDSGLQATAENIYGGQTVMTAKTATHIALRTSESGTWTLDAVPALGDTLAVCVSSVKAGGVSSRVSVYTRHWRPVKTALPHMEPKSFFTASPTLTPDSLLQTQLALDACPLRAEWDTESATLRVSVSTDGLTSSWRAAAAACLRERRFSLKSGHFTEVESTPPAQRK